MTTNLDKIKFKDEIDSGANFMLEPMHLKAHALENDLSPGSHRNCVE